MTRFSTIYPRRVGAWLMAISAIAVLLILFFGPWQEAAPERVPPDLMDVYELEKPWMLELAFGMGVLGIVLLIFSKRNRKQDTIRRPLTTVDR